MRRASGKSISRLSMPRAYLIDILSIKYAALSASGLIQTNMPISMILALCYVFYYMYYANIFNFGVIFTLIIVNAAL